MGRSEEKTRESDTLRSPKDACDAQAALRERACGAHSGRPSGACGVAPGARDAGSGGWPGRGVLRPIGGARARSPSPPAARALACRPAAHVFLFCVVAFVLEARIYILSVSGEWAGALVRAGKRRSRRPVFQSLPFPFSHHSNQPATMPRKKGAAWEEPSSGNGTARAGPRRRGGPAGRKRERPERCSSSSGGGSSGDEDGPELDGAPGGGKRAARPAAAGKAGGTAAIITEPEHTKERVKLEGSKCKGQLLIFGATNWDLIGRKEVPKQQAAYRNLGQNLWGPHRYGCLSGVRVRTVVSGSCAAHSLLITTEGKLWSWGRNEKGQLGHGDTKRVEAPRLIEALSHEAIVLAACGRNHTLALTDTGSVFAFGENKMGQLGLGNQTDAVPSPAQIMYNGQPITKMACGAEFSMLMDCKGNLYSFGCPEYGQLGHNSDGKFIARAQRIEYDCELVPRRVAIFIEKTKDGQILPVPNVVVRDVACGANHTLVLDSQKRVFSWGFGGYGRLGHAEQKDEMVPRLVKLFDFPGRGATQIYAGYTCSFAVSEVGGLFFWGATNTSRESTMYPKAVQDLCGWRIRSLACGKSSIIVAADESTISWGPSPTFGELGYGDHKPKSSTAAQEVKTLDGIFSEQVAMGYSHSLVIARDESEAEKEKLKRLPEYTPRTL